MATTVDSSLRQGGADLFVFAYGNNFAASVHSILDLSEEGVRFNLETYENLVRSGRSTGLIDTVDGVEALVLELDVPTHTMENIALSLGQTLADVADNIAATPPNIEVKVGSSFQRTFYEVQIKAPQVQNATLFDVLELYKVRFKPAYNQAFTVQKERFIPLKIMAVKDPNNSNDIFRFYSEGV